MNYCWADICLEAGPFEPEDAQIHGGLKALPPLGLTSFFRNLLGFDLIKTIKM